MARSIAITHTLLCCSTASISVGQEGCCEHSPLTHLVSFHGEEAEAEMKPLRHIPPTLRPIPKTFDFPATFKSSRKLKSDVYA